MKKHEFNQSVQQENDQLKSQLQKYKDELQKCQSQLEHTNRLYEENLRQHDEVMKHFKNPTVTTSTVRTSSMMSKSIVAADKPLPGLQH